MSIGMIFHENPVVLSRQSFGVLTYKFRFRFLSTKSFDCRGLLYHEGFGCLQPQMQGTQERVMDRSSHETWSVNVP